MIFQINYMFLMIFKDVLSSLLPYRIRVSYCPDSETNTVIHQMQHVVPVGPLQERLFRFTATSETRYE